jgi:hypothetical protein
MTGRRIEARTTGQQHSFIRRCPRRPHRH